MSSTKLSLIDRAEHGDAKAIVELLTDDEIILWREDRIYWAWQALIHSAPMQDVPEKDLYKVLRWTAAAKQSNFLTDSEKKLFESLIGTYKKLHPGRAYVVLYFGASNDKLERQYLEAGCKAKSRHCAGKLADKLWMYDNEYLKAAELCFEACTWPFDEVSDFEEFHSDEELKKKGCDHILRHLLHNKVELKDARPLLLKVYQNGDDEQKKESAEELEKRTLDFLEPLVTRAEGQAQQRLYKEAADLYAKLLEKKDQLVKQLPKHDQLDELFRNIRNEKLKDVFFNYLAQLTAKARSLEKYGDYAEAVRAYEEILAKRKTLFAVFIPYLKDGGDGIFALIEDEKNKCAEKTKSRITYVLLAILLGYLGAHDFYAGSPKKAMCKLLLTLLSCGLLAPASWLLSLCQVLDIEANIGVSIRQRKESKHGMASIIGCVILNIILLSAWGNLLKGDEPASSEKEEACPTSQQGVTTPLTLGGTPNVSTSTSGMMKLPTAENSGSSFETTVPLTLQGTPVSAKSPTEQLQEAVKKGDAQEVKSLIEQGVDAGIKDGLGRDLLMIAVQNGDIQTIGVLLEKQPKWDSAQKLLIDSVNNSKADIVEVLVTHGVTPNTYKDEKGKTLLHLAVDAESLETVQALLKGKADPNARNNEGRTPIYSAIYRQNGAIVKALLDGGAKTKVQDKWSITPLEFAKERSSKSSILTLLKNSRK